MKKMFRVAAALGVVAAIAALPVHAAGTTETASYYGPGAGATCINFSVLVPSVPNVCNGGVDFDLTTITANQIDSITISDGSLTGVDGDWQLETAPNPVSGNQTTLASGFVCNGVFTGPQAIDPSASTLFVSIDPQDFVSCGDSGSPAATTGTINFTYE